MGGGGTLADPGILCELRRRWGPRVESRETDRQPPIDMYKVTVSSITEWDLFLPGEETA